MVIGIAFIVAGIMTNEPQIKKPVKVGYFRSGDLLLPDYACPDTLIVTDGEGLSNAIALIEQGIIEATDYAIDSTIHNYAVIYTKNSGLQPENFEQLVMHK